MYTIHAELQMIQFLSRSDLTYYLVIVVNITHSKLTDGVLTEPNAYHIVCHEIDSVPISDYIIMSWVKLGNCSTECENGQYVRGENKYIE